MNLSINKKLSGITTKSAVQNQAATATTSASTVKNQAASGKTGSAFASSTAKRDFNNLTKNLNPAKPRPTTGSQPKVKEKKNAKEKKGATAKKKAELEKKEDKVKDLSPKELKKLKKGLSSDIKDELNSRLASQIKDKIASKLKDLMSKNQKDAGKAKKGSSSEQPGNTEKAKKGNPKSGENDVMQAAPGGGQGGGGKAGGAGGGKGGGSSTSGQEQGSDQELKSAHEEAAKDCEQLGQKEEKPQASTKGCTTWKKLAKTIKDMASTAVWKTFSGGVLGTCNSAGKQCYSTKLKGNTPKLKEVIVHECTHQIEFTELGTSDEKDTYNIHKEYSNKIGNKGGGGGSKGS